jgi:intraflagellar transport protein 88
MCKAIHYLKTKEFEKAIDCLKQFSKKEPAQQAKAAANLSFIYYLEGEHDLAKKYAKMAVENDNFNARALVNLGNCFMHKVTAGKDGKDGFGLNGAGNSAHNATEGLAVLSGDAKQNLEQVRLSLSLSVRLKLTLSLQAAKCYESAIKVEADCVEAVYNLGLSQKRAGNHTEALKTFKKCHTIVPDSVEVRLSLVPLSFTVCLQLTPLLPPSSSFFFDRFFTSSPISLNFLTTSRRP